jgi:hypothetical protein
MDEDSPEIAYYRAVEDLFSSLRGVPHVLSPRDFQLLRSWWRDEIPYAAVAAGLTEVFARDREREDGDTVVSLAYCRHAVKRQAKRLAEMHVGSAHVDRASTSPDPGIGSLVEALRSTASKLSDSRPAVAEVLRGFVSQMELAANDLTTEALDEHLFDLESAMLHSCWLALDDKDRRAIEARSRSSAESSATTQEARQRSARALRDREIRLLLGLPRLELGG